MSKATSAKPVSERVKELRASNGWTQEDLAAKSDVSVPTIQRVEGGKPISADTMKALASAFQIPARQLVGRLPDAPASASESDYLPLRAIATARELLESLSLAKVIEFDYDDLPNEQLAEALEVFYNFCKERTGSPVPDSPKERFRTQAETIQQLKALQEKRVTVAGNTYTRTCYEVDEDECGGIPMLLAKWEETCLLLRFEFSGEVADRAYIDYSRQPKYSNIDDPKIVRTKKPELEKANEDEIPF